MRRSVTIASGLSLILLGACATTAPAPSVGPVTLPAAAIVMTPAQLATQATTVLNGLEAGIAVYIASTPGAISPSAQADLAAAEVAAGVLIAGIGTSDIGAAAHDALTVANTLAIVANQVPGLPIEAKAGLIAFQILVAVLEPTTAPTVTAATNAPTVAPLPMVPDGSPVGIHLVPNQ